eukprot:COSAG02_NODE_105_length_36393_cov_15.694495_3_plen_150_part_00
MRAGPGRSRRLLVSRDAILFAAWQIVNPDGSIKVIKVAVDPVWHLPRLAEAVGVGETLLRERLAQWTQNNTVLDPDNKVFLPSIGGTTLYLFGDPSAITDPDREVACRPHDECNGSDVFGTDICTCRPYLVYVSLSVTVSKPSAEAASP